MNESARIVVKPNLSINANEARDLRARALAYAITCYEAKANKRPAAGPSQRGVNDGTEA